MDSFEREKDEFLEMIIAEEDEKIIAALLEFARLLKDGRQP